MYLEKYQLLTRNEAQEIVIELEEMDVWKQGQARTKWATGTVKQNQEMNWADGDKQKVLTNRARNWIVRHPRLGNDHLIKKVMTPKFNRYAPETGNTYQRHGDSHCMGGKVRTDIAMTIFLSHPNTYEGGVLHIEMPDGRTSIEAKGDPGMAVVYPCWRPHWVTPVTSGVRICAITWLESMIRSEEKREIMRRFGTALRQMEDDPQLRNSEYMASLGTVKGKILRLWADVPEMGI